MTYSSLSLLFNSATGSKVDAFFHGTFFLLQIGRSTAREQLACTYCSHYPSCPPPSASRPYNWASAKVSRCYARSHVSETLEFDSSIRLISGQYDLLCRLMPREAGPASIPFDSLLFSRGYSFFQTGLNATTSEAGRASRDPTCLNRFRSIWRLPEILLVARRA